VLIQEGVPDIAKIENVFDGFESELVSMNNSMIIQDSRTFVEAETPVFKDDSAVKISIVSDWVS